jgi:hypothetical protein
MAKRIRVPISTARTRLFQLADLVRQSGDDSVVVLEQRGGSEPVALVREARLAYLEERVGQLDRRETTFTLAGSLATDMRDDLLDQALRELRLEWGKATAPEPPAAGRRNAGRAARPRR